MASSRACSTCLRSVTFLVLLPAAARTRIVSTDLLRRLWWRHLMMMMLVLVIMVVLGLALEHRLQTREPQPFVQRELDQLRLERRQRRDRIDLSQHPPDPPARRLARHGERI